MKGIYQYKLVEDTSVFPPVLLNQPM